MDFKIDFNGRGYTTVWRNDDFFCETGSAKAAEEIVDAFKKAEAYAASCSRIDRICKECGIDTDGLDEIGCVEALEKGFSRDT